MMRFDRLENVDLGFCMEHSTFKRRRIRIGELHSAFPQKESKHTPNERASSPRFLLHISLLPPHASEWVVALHHPAAAAPVAVGRAVEVGARARAAARVATGPDPDPQRRSKDRGRGRHPARASVTAVATDDATAAGTATTRVARARAVVMTAEDLVDDMETEVAEEDVRNRRASWYAIWTRARL